MTQVPDDRREDDVGERVARVRGLKLPGLKRWRIHRGFTQKELAERVDMPLQYISRVEQGKTHHILWL
jgi:DNA-binding XRE family transcriptional regulator